MNGLTKKNTTQIGFHIKKNILDLYNKKNIEKNLVVQKSLRIALLDYIGISQPEKVKLNPLTDIELTILNESQNEYKSVSLKFEEDLKKQVESFCDKKGMNKTGLLRAVIKHELGL